MSNNESARARVAEFLRQWALAKSNDQRCIYGIMSDPQADEVAELLVADLRALIEQPEPTYEYGFRWVADFRPVPPTFNSAEEAQDWLDFSKRNADEYVMMRRPKVKWEDVK